MSTPALPSTGGSFSVLPTSLRTALVVATVVALASGGLLATRDITTTPSEIAGPGDKQAAPILGSGKLGLTSPSPGSATTEPRTEAVITVPGAGSSSGTRGKGLPTFGRYVFTVQGSEQGPALSRRTLPPEMTITVHQDPDGPALEGNEVAFDLQYSAEHTEHEVLGYTQQGITLRHETIEVSFGTTVYGGDVELDPGVVQIPASLSEGTTVDGISTATADDGSVKRTEDWSVEVEGQEQITVRGEDVDAWVVSMARTSQASSEEQFTRTRKYWFDPAAGLWVRFEEQTSIRQGSGLGATAYSSQLVATLDRVEPL